MLRQLGIKAKAPHAQIQALDLEEKDETQISHQIPLRRESQIMVV